MKHINLLIVTKTPIFHAYLNNLSYLHFHNISVFTSQNTTNQDPKITFDYLITDQPSILTLLHPMSENGWIITNHAFQTSIEHIYFIGEENQSQLSINQQFESSLQHILQINQ